MVWILLVFLLIVIGGEGEAKPSVDPSAKTALGRPYKTNTDDDTYDPSDVKTFPSKKRPPKTRPDKTTIDDTDDKRPPKTPNGSDGADSKDCIPVWNGQWTPNYVPPPVWIPYAWPPSMYGPYPVGFPGQPVGFPGQPIQPGSLNQAGLSKQAGLSGQAGSLKQAGLPSQSGKPPCFYGYQYYP